MTFRAGMPGSEEAELLEPLLGDRYQLVRLIGRGGMGAVFVGRDRRLHRSVAIKTLRADVASDPAWRASFLREARMTAQLQHDGIVPVLDALESEATAAVIMPFAGWSLDQVLAEAGGWLTPERARDVLHCVADALAYVHRAGVLHRDIKPANVMVERDRQTWRVRLTDFGIAVVPLRDDHWRNTLAGPAGSPGFAAPEQLMSRVDTDARSDVYALGALGYLMCTGMMPFGDASGQVRLERQLQGRLTSVRALAPDVSRRLAGIIERCLDPEPRGRWRGAGEVRDALARLNGRSWLARLRRLVPTRVPSPTRLPGLDATAAARLTTMV